MSHHRIVFALAVACQVTVLPLAPVLGSEDGEKPTLFTGDLGNIIWSLLTFAVVLLVLGRFAWRPLLGGLQRREDFIRDSLKKAKEDREAAEARLKEYSDKLAAARADATAIVEEGRRNAEVLKSRIEDHAKTEAAAIIERGKREIAIATDTAVKEIYALSAKLATDVASRVIRKEVDGKQHERLLRESIDELSKAYRN